MKLVFLLFEYFPFGGLQRDCLKTALVCASRGHEVTVLTRTWEGEKPAEIRIETYGRRGLTNMARNRHWLNQLRASLPSLDFDVVIGFNKMPGLDVYFGADPCFAHKVNESKPYWYRWFPRYRHYAALERAVFAPGQRTQILQLTPHEIPTYKRIYGTEDDRFHLLPPMAARHFFTEEERLLQRRRLRGGQGWPDDEFLLLFVGSDFRRKGLDRVLESMAALGSRLRRQTRLVVLGQCEPGRFARLAGRLGMAERVHFLGGRMDAPDWMLAADILVHPAYVETAGAVLVEALTHGLPVLTTETCGYAFHVQKAGAGVVMAEPFSPQAFQTSLRDLLTSVERRAECRRRALAYAATEDLYHCHQRAAEIIEATAAAKVPIRS